MRGTAAGLSWRARPPSFYQRKRLLKIDGLAAWQLGLPAVGIAEHLAISHLNFEDLSLSHFRGATPVRVLLDGDQSAAADSLCQEFRKRGCTAIPLRLLQGHTVCPTLRQQHGTARMSDECRRCERRRTQWGRYEQARPAPFAWLG
jgi:hypothetical protein